MVSFLNSWCKNVLTYRNIYQSHNAFKGVTELNYYFGIVEVGNNKFDNVVNNDKYNDEDLIM